MASKTSHHGVRLRNTTVRDLLGNKVFTEAVLAFLRDTQASMIKEEILKKVLKSAPTS